MNRLHFGVKQLKNGNVLHSFAWNHVKYANMEGFHRDIHNYYSCNYNTLHKSSHKLRTVEFIISVHSKTVCERQCYVTSLNSQSTLVDKHCI